MMAAVIEPYCHVNAEEWPCRSVSIIRGKRPLFLPELVVGTATVTLAVPDGWTFDLVPGNNVIFPGRLVNVVAHVAGGASQVVVFRGYVAEAIVTPSPSGLDQELTLRLVDGIKQAQTVGPDPANEEEGTNERSIDRVDRILDRLTLPVAGRNLIDDPTTGNTHSATFHTVSPLQELNNIIRDDAAFMWLDTSDTWQFRGLNIVPPVAIPLAVSVWSPSWSAESQINTIRQFNPDTQGFAENIDPTGVAQFGERAFIINNSTQNKFVWMAPVSNDLMAMFRAPRADVTVFATDTLIANRLAFMDLFDPIATTQTVGNAQTVDVDGRVERIAHKWAAGRVWTTELSLRGIDRT